MKAGKLRQRVVLQRRDPDAVPNEFNELPDEWIDLDTVWAAIRPVTGREFYASQQTQSDLTHEIEIRYYAGIDEKDRVKWIDPKTTVTRLFDIKTVTDFEERHVQMFLRCVEHHD